MQLISAPFIKGRKLWTFDKGIRTVEDIFILKLQLTEIQRKLDVCENSKVVYDLQQNELHEDNILQIKVLDVQFLKSTTSSNMLKGKSKMEDQKFVFRSFFLLFPSSHFFGLFPSLT